jgi:hypothetical protein
LFLLKEERPRSEKLFPETATTGEASQKKTEVREHDYAGASAE